MSMGNYAVNDYGFVLTEDDFKLLASKVCENFIEEEYDCYEWSYIDEVCEKLGIDYMSEFTGETFLIREDGYDEWWSSMMYNAEYIGYYLLNTPSLFKAAYNNMNEMIQSVKEIFSEYFPEDFDYRSHIRHIIGTYYG